MHSGNEIPWPFADADFQMPICTQPQLNVFDLFPVLDDRIDNDHRRHMNVKCLIILCRPWQVFPSEFGLQRMREEALSGPTELVQLKQERGAGAEEGEGEEGEEEEGEEEDFDESQGKMNGPEFTVTCNYFILHFVCTELIHDNCFWQI